MTSETAQGEMNNATARELTAHSKMPGSFRTFYWLLLICCLCAVLCNMGMVLRFLPATGDNVYPESAAVLSAKRWASGLPLYEDYRRSPYIVTAFPPLWYALLTVPAKFGAADLDSLTVFGRLLNLLCLLALTGVGYLWNRRLGQTVALAVLTPVLYLTFPILIPWAVAVRPDFPSLLLAVLALYLMTRRSTVSMVCLAGMLGGLAFLIRHNAVAVPVAIVLWLLWQKRWKHALAFCVIWGTVVASTLVVFHFTTNGMMTLNLSGAKFGRLALTYSRDTVLRLFAASGNGFALVLFMLGVLGVLYSWTGADKLPRLASVYLVVSLGLALFGSATAGGDVNHFFEPAFAMALLAPIGVMRLQSGWSGKSPVCVFATITLACLLLPSLDLQRWRLMHESPTNVRDLLPLAEKRHVLTDIPFLAARMQTPQALDLASLTNASKAGQWSSDAIVEDLQRGRYQLVILQESLSTTDEPQIGYYPRYAHLNPAVQRAVRSNYSLCFQRDRYFVYAPKANGKNLSDQGCPAGGSELSGSGVLRQ